MLMAIHLQRKAKGNNKTGSLKQASESDKTVMT